MVVLLFILAALIGLGGYGLVESNIALFLVALGAGISALVNVSLNGRGPEATLTLLAMVVLGVIAIVIFVVDFFPPATAP